MNTFILKTELIRAIRGKQSQSYLNRKLGYQGNQISRWESGERSISWLGFVDLCEVSNIDVSAALTKIFGYTDDPKNFSKLMTMLIGDMRVTEVANIIGRSRFSITRWLEGKTVPDLEQFLQVIDACHFVLFEFLEEIVDVNLIPSISDEYQTRKAQKEQHYKYPVTDAILACLELDDYKKLKKYRRGFVAEKVGISIEEEDTILDILIENQILQKDSQGKLIPHRGRPDLRGNRNGEREIRAYWLKRATEFNQTHFLHSTNSSFGTNVLPSNAEAAQKIKEEYFMFYHRVRSILQATEGPLDRVQVFNFQLFDLSGE